MARRVTIAEYPSEWRFGVPFPRTNEEFLELLRSRGVPHPESWIETGQPLDRSKVAQYLFLDALWSLCENPNDSSYSKERVERHKKSELDLHPLRKDRVMLLAENILDVGVEPEQLSTIILAAQQDLLFDLLYMLDDNEFGAHYSSSDELCYGIFEASSNDDFEKIPEGQSWSLNDLLPDARPGSYPPHPRTEPKTQ